MEATLGLAVDIRGINRIMVWDATLKGFTTGRITGAQELTPIGVMPFTEMAFLPVGLKGKGR